VRLEGTHAVSVISGLCSEQDRGNGLDGPTNGEDVEYRNRAIPGKEPREEAPQPSSRLLHM
jgi:hypothetical protein